MHPPFVKGLDLSQTLYKEAVRPILEAEYSGLPHSAALLGPGSEVLGYDTAQSMDHDWGPRLMLFLSQADHLELGEEIHDLLRAELPHTIRGIPTSLALTGGDNPWAPAPEGEPTDHSVQVLTVAGLCQHILGFDPFGPIQATDWLGVPKQQLLSVTSGRVFHDGLGQLRPIRDKLRYYPRDVWLYLLAAQWGRIGQENHFMGRCGQVGDDLGSRLLAGRLVKDVMRLCFLMERRYAPYIKWFGTAFAQLECAEGMLPILQSALQAESWRERETHLRLACEMMARIHNGLAITEPLPTGASRFHKRPFMVIDAEAFERALMEAVASRDVLALPAALGSVDQFLDSTDALNHRARFRGVFEPRPG